MGTKTIGIGIISVEYHGGLLEHFVGPKPALPGITIMVPAGIYCVLTAGDKATRVYKQGPHELDLMDFNRQPSGRLYLVTQEPRGRTGINLRGDVERHLEIQVGDPLAFVQHFVIGEGLDEETEVWKFLFGAVDKVMSTTERPPIRETLEELLGDSEAQWGLRITDFFEQPARPATPEKRTLRIRKTPFPTSTPENAQTASPKQGQTVENDKEKNSDTESQKAEPKQGEVKLTHVWASSTMDLFGNGELTINIRLFGGESKAAIAAGQLRYDYKKTFNSPDGWLEAERWQALPDGALVFSGVDLTQPIHFEVEAEERDPGSVDSLGHLAVTLTPKPGTFEIGPTEGGKKRQFIKLKGTIA